MVRLRCSLHYFYLDACGFSFSSFWVSDYKPTIYGLSFLLFDMMSRESEGPQSASHINLACYNVLIILSFFAWEWTCIQLSFKISFHLYAFQIICLQFSVRCMAWILFRMLWISLVRNCLLFGTILYKTLWMSLVIFCTFQLWIWHWLIFLDLLK